MKLKNSYSEGKISQKSYVHYQLIRMGKDLMIIISGGLEHIGSIAYTIDSLNPVFRHYTYEGHREDEIVLQSIEKLSPLVPGHLLVVCGIHYDDITRTQIDSIRQNCSKIISRIESDLKIE